MSAPTLSVINSTPYSITCLAHGNDGGPASIPWANLEGSVTRRGPLKALLDALDAAHKLDTLNLDGVNSGRVRIRWVSGVDATQSLPLTFMIKWTMTGIALDLPTNTHLCLEIRHSHSRDR